MFPGVGIVGIDDSSTHYIKKFQENSFKINGICGPNILNLRRIAKDFDINFVTSKVEDLLVHNEINLILFMPVASNIAEHVCKALTVAGKHVICCHAFAVSSKYAQEMYEASLKYPTLLSVIENPIRFSKNFTNAKNLLLKNEIGQILYIDCTIEASPFLSAQDSFNSELETEIGLFQKYGILLVDAIINIISVHITTVQCNFMTINMYPNKNKIFKRSNVDDYFTFFAKFENGVPMNVTGRVSSSCPIGYYGQSVVIVGTTGKILLENDSIELVLFDQEIQCDQIDKFSKIPQTIYKFPPAKDDYLDDLVRELKQIFSRGKYDPNKEYLDKLISFDKGLYLRSIIDAAHHSSVSGNSSHLSEHKPPTTLKKLDNDFTSIHFKPSEKISISSKKEKPSVGRKQKNLI